MPDNEGESRTVMSTPSMQRIRWRNVDAGWSTIAPRLGPPCAWSLTRPSSHWTHAVGRDGVVHLRRLDGLRGPWEATLERPNGIRVPLFTHLSVAKVQARAERLIRLSTATRLTARVLDAFLHGGDDDAPDADDQIDKPKEETHDDDNDEAILHLPY